MLDIMLISNVLLWFLMIVAFVMVLALSRQVGVLYERVAPAGALMMNETLKTGMEAPRIEVQDLNGEKFSVGGISGNGKSQLLFFLSPNCPVCKTLLPALKSAAKSEQAWLDLTLASDGKESEHRQYIVDHDLSSYRYVSSELLGRSYSVAKLPYAVLIDERGKIASMGVINSREHIESLFESKESGVFSIQEFLAS